MKTSLADNDSSLRFLFEALDIRGESVKLKNALAELAGSHEYSPSVRELLGEFAAAAVLISNNLKYDGRIILQARSQSALTLVMVECSSDLKIRGIARGDIGAVSEAPFTLIDGGQLVITIEREGGQRYQGIVAVDAASLAESLDSYFQQSEQLNTRFWLASDGENAAGMMLQQLPAQIQQSAEHRQNQWQEVMLLADTITTKEQLELPSEQVLHRLFHEYPVRTFEPKNVIFHCSCSRERSLNALTTLSPGELEDIFVEQGSIDMTCEMCGTPYQFERKDIPGLAEPPVLH